MDNKTKIDSLKKITLLVEAGTTLDVMDLTPQPLEVEFIFGLGREGLTPFEYELAEKTEGDEVVIWSEHGNIHNMFQHLHIHFPFIYNPSLSFYLKVRVIKIMPTEPREVIKALAEIGSCGAHCCGH